MPPMAPDSPSTAALEAAIAAGEVVSEVGEHAPPESAHGGDGDTIVAVVTGAQPGAAVAIVRLSGPEAVAVAQRVFRQSGGHRGDQGGTQAPWQPETHCVYHGRLVDDSGAALDEVLALAMLAPRSYTREDVVELHTHGGAVCAARAVTACLAAGARRARAGEFTLRAFLNGRLDLAQAEAVAALVGARTAAAADSALAGLAGGAGAAVAAMRAAALSLLAEIEAGIDFEVELPQADVAALRTRLEALRNDVEGALATARRGQLLNRGLQVALVGRPNVGKSSLLNALSGSERAIVTHIPGTTRDVVEAGMEVGGVAVTLLDTAGLRAASDAVERIGVARSHAAAAAADVVMLVYDAQVGWTEADAAAAEGLWGGRQANQSLPRPALAGAGRLLHARSAADAAAAATSPAGTAAVATAGADDEATTHRADGAAVAHAAGLAQVAPGGQAWAVNERQAEALQRAAEALRCAAASAADGLPLDFWALDLRGALLALGEVTGDEASEQVLDEVFSSFCIGK
ncbi:hypothetical protein WJX81_008606 [Elliptochloris bilobata]|uniref:tRNA modification GTPase n=1 Tax=Elliptochloris bilobata TaxID=381761 RepID=A0AAW1R0P9_9CHLO